ncbi:MAG: hypothetical protein ABIB71_02220 [Candidatus Woesearchaeota archaeon]
MITPEYKQKSLEELIASKGKKWFSVEGNKVQAVAGKEHTLIHLPGYWLRDENISLDKDVEPYYSISFGKKEHRFYTISFLNNHSFMSSIAKACQKTLYAATGIILSDKASYPQLIQKFENEKNNTEITEWSMFRDKSFEERHFLHWYHEKWLNKERYRKKCHPINIKEDFKTFLKLKGFRELS